MQETQKNERTISRVRNFQNSGSQNSNAHYINFFSIYSKKIYYVIVSKGYVSMFLKIWEIHSLRESHSFKVTKNFFIFNCCIDFL